MVENSNLSNFPPTLVRDKRWQRQLSASIREIDRKPEVGLRGAQRLLHGQPPHHRHWPRSDPLLGSSSLRLPRVGSFSREESGLESLKLQRHGCWSQLPIWGRELHPSNLQPLFWPKRYKAFYWRRTFAERCQRQLPCTLAITPAKICFEDACRSYIIPRFPGINVSAIWFSQGSSSLTHQLVEWNKCVLFLVICKKFPYLVLSGECLVLQTKQWNFKQWQNRSWGTSQGGSGDMNICLLLLDFKSLFGSVWLRYNVEYSGCLACLTRYNIHSSGFSPRGEQAWKGYKGTWHINIEALLPIQFQSL